ncbi:unnamed protein product [Toxocara canis]|uniref:snRNA-activating protein complex subunit 4 n=1 Tax=Toxocara canis TaxID=6265 RepID=A0A183UL44_TOXCA|nr:unnamed protein product [Toxocara canis]
MPYSGERRRGGILMRDLYRERLYEGAGKAGEVDIKYWRQVIASMERRIEYVKQLDDSVILRGDYSEVDWLAMANVTFRNGRTARQLRLKWLNEQCPQWSKEEWSYEEIKRLYLYAINPSRISSLSWDIIAEELDTDRTPFQYFTKLREIKEEIANYRPWTKEEDAWLATVVNASQCVGTVRWRPVASFMDDRSLNDCFLRYKRNLDSRHTRGNWTEHEKLVLNYAVSEFGSYNWMKISSVVGTRNSTQCRGRYILAKLINPWTPREDEILLNAVKCFGEGQWALVAGTLQGRSRRQCRKRYRTLRASTIEAKLYEMNIDEIVDEETLDNDTKEFISRLPEEERDTMSNAVLEIAEKSSFLDRTFSQLVNDDMQIKKEYLNDESLQLLKRHYDRALRKLLGIAPRRKYVVRLLNLKERKRITGAYDCLNNDEDRKNFLQKALVSLIKRADEERARAAHARLRKVPVLKKNYRFFRRTVLKEVLDAMESNPILPPLPPCLASIQLMESLKDGDNDMLVLNIAAATKKDIFYRYLAAQMRRLLFVPLLMDRAIEEEAHWRERARLREIAKKQIASQACCSPKEQAESVESGSRHRSSAGLCATSAFVHSMKNLAGKPAEEPAMSSTEPEHQTSRRSVKRKAAQPTKSGKRRRRNNPPSSEDESDISEDELELSDEEDEVELFSKEEEFDDDDDDYLSYEEEEESSEEMEW